jgi:hypothetical protein
MTDFRPNSRDGVPVPAAPRNLKSAVEALNNLIYVASQEADRPEQVRVYLELAQEQMNTIIDALKKGAVWTIPFN